MSTPSPIAVLLPGDGESWTGFLHRIRKASGETLVVIVDRDADLEERKDLPRQIVAACAAAPGTVMLATKQPHLAAEARDKGLRVIGRSREIRTLLKGHPQFNEVFRVFSPQQWKRQLKSRLQHMGLLSVPKLRVYVIAALSGLLFFVVVFKLLPSAEIAVSPRQETLSQTVNIYLAGSGAAALVPSRLRTMPLLPLTVVLEKSVASDHVSKRFMGTVARLNMAIANTTDEPYALRKGTRFTNEAGMVFRIQESVVVPPKNQLTVAAVADELDIYGQIIGARGNVPAGLTWRIPGLPEDVRLKVYGKNPYIGTGGTTVYRSVLTKEDIELARKRLEQELLADARVQIERQRKAMNDLDPSKIIVLLDPKRYPELTHTAYEGEVLPMDRIGQDVPQVVATGRIRYTVFAYDAQEILDVLRAELSSHVREGRALLAESVDLSRMVSHVIDYADDLSWIKLTVDLTGMEQYVLDPLSPQGAIFAKRVREQVAGLPMDDALRIIRNLPEVENAEISSWPPWSRTLPTLPSHISVVAQ